MSVCLSVRSYKNLDLRDYGIITRTTKFGVSIRNYCTHIKFPPLQIDNIILMEVDSFWVSTITINFQMIPQYLIAIG